MASPLPPFTEESVNHVPGPKCQRCRRSVPPHKLTKAAGPLAPFETDVPAAGGLQMNDLLHARGLPDANTPVLIRITVIRGMLGAYAAVIDNGTNDPAYYAANLASKQ